MSAATLALLLAATPPPDDWHAIVIGNNASPTQQRPSLSYADDDALRFALTLSPLVPPERRVVLTRLDRDSLRFERLGVTVSGPPTKAAVTEAFAAVSAQVRTVKAAGRRAGLYVFFGGHGDIEGGEGFLELDDDRLMGRELERLLQQVGADEAHVILDSCNSFFVLNPRKPGGRRFATSADIASALGQRLPNVGVFLSTSADAESWEWSELQAGVFSHLVRSGLAGPADLDGDDVITYAELRDFVTVATKDVQNPRLRPLVFARGPGGHSERALFRVPKVAVRGVTDTSSTAVRVTLRDPEGTRWLDAHVEAGHRLSLRVAESLGDFLRLERSDVQGSRVLGEPAATLSQLPPASADSVAARGEDVALHALFATPFGPTSVGALEPAEVSYGVSESEWTRLVTTVERLDAIEEAELSRGALIGGTAVAALATASLVAGLTRNRPCSEWCDAPTTWADLMFLALGASLSTGLNVVVGVNSHRKLHALAEDARDRSSQPEFDRTRYAERAERLFLADVKESRKTLLTAGLVGAVGFTVMLGLAIVTPFIDLASERPVSLKRTFIDLGWAAVFGVQFADLIFRGDERLRLMTQWLDGATVGPTAVKVKVGVTAHPGGAGIGLSGRF